MALIPDEVRRQLEEHFRERLTGPAHLTVYTKPGSSRLVLPAGYGCATCEEAREMGQILRDAAPDKLTLEEVDVTKDTSRTEIDQIEDVPTIAVSADSDDRRIRFQGLATGTEFPALIDAIERVSRKEHGLSATSLEELQKLTEPIEVMVFATPT